MIILSDRSNYSSGTPWESIAGYSRAVRVGNIIEVAGTTAVDAEGQVVGAGDIGEQTDYIFNKIRNALNDAGSKMSDVIRTRMYLTDINDWETVARVHGDIFSDIKPVSTLVEVGGLIDEELLIEIEVSAVVSDIV
ncbi:MAG: RidA family protein [Candidatus Thermoplasmatota archaeon]|nr:RidA family protein [Candidatus Thermoplasmatota archaeon]MEC9138116.1 RidA family protein [Candidatus Thermoplasmatota archaeon]